MNSFTNLTPQQLRQAADIQERILQLQDQLDSIMGGSGGGIAATPSVANGSKRRLSAQGLANIRAGARKRWGKVHATNGNGAGSRKRRGKMSPAGRAAIAARMRARWAAAKRAGRNAL
jgi:hypothetical protein